MTMVDNIFQPALADRQPFATGFLTQAVRHGRLSHAYLLVGRALSDKWQIARNLACFLNCANVQAGGSACVLKLASADRDCDTKEFCSNCRWIWEGKHPQAWLTLGSDGSKSGKVAVEKARALGDELAKESQFTRTVVIENANQDMFHRPAANALLKTIEDPKVSCIFFLFSIAEQEVLPTVVSRCQVVPLRTTDSLGSSLLAIEIAHIDPEIVQLAQNFTDRLIHRRDAQAVARLLDFNRELNERFSEQFTASGAIDLLVALELKNVSAKALDSADMSGYAKRLIELAESTKEQLLHYVMPKAAMESFSLSWWKLAGQAHVELSVRA
jgi:DNA polymerase III delta prime subunit